MRLRNQGKVLRKKIQRNVAIRWFMIKSHYFLGSVKKCDISDMAIMNELKNLLKREKFPKPINS